jgi:protein-S-isoprenylcysteine O-methyltransferase Ste14
MAVFGLLLVFLALGYLVAILLELPMKLNFSLPVRFVGLLVIFFDCIWLGWLIKYRRPMDILVSTYVTFSKMFSRIRLEERSVRNENLVVKGPYRHVRHPLYFGVFLLVLGAYVLLGSTALIVSATLLLVWLNFVVTPFEEKELRAIFGENYNRYARRVPKIIPFTKRPKP